MWEFMLVLILMCIGVMLGVMFVESILKRTNVNEVPLQSTQKRCSIRQ